MEPSVPAGMETEGKSFEQVQSDATWEPNGIAEDLSAAFDAVTGTPAPGGVDNRAGPAPESDVRADIEGALTSGAPPASTGRPTYEEALSAVNAMKQEAEKSGDLEGYEDAERLEFRVNLDHMKQFMFAKDAKGQLLHPYFDDVAQGIAIELRAATHAGKPITLAQAYERAVWANPITRVKQLNAREAAMKAKEEAARPKPRPGADTLHSDLARNYDAVAGRR